MGMVRDRNQRGGDDEEWGWEGGDGEESGW